MCSWRALAGMPAAPARALGSASRSPLRAWAWLLLGLWAGAAALPVPADAQGSGDRPSEERAAAGLTATLVNGLAVGSKVLVRPFATRYTGLPESAATRLEGLIVKALSTGIPDDMEVTLVTGEDVARIYRGLEESSFDGASGNLLTSVLRAARADTIVACEHVGESRPDSLVIQCGATSGRLVCTDGSDDIGRCEAVEVAEVRSLGSETAAFPWASTEEYLDHVFSNLAWRLVGASPPDVPGEVEIEAAHRNTLLDRFITSRLEMEVERAIRSRVGWRRVEGPSEGPPLSLDWSVIPWGDERYWLTATLEEGDNPDGGGFSVTGDTHIEISSLPPNLRPVGTGNGEFPARSGLDPVVDPVVDPGGGDRPPPDDLDAVDPAGAIERAKYERGLERAREAKDHAGVLRFLERLADLGGPRPPDADYYRGEAHFAAGRHGAAREALERYAARGAGEYYDRSLDLLLALDEEEEEAFARAKAADTASSYDAYLSSYPSGRHAVEAKELLTRASAREEAARKEAAREEAERERAAEDAAFERARSSDTVSSYAAYLASYPAGRHAVEAGRLRARAASREEAAREALAASSREESLGLDYAARVNVQRGLSSLGLEVGSADGLFGAPTRVALRSWQAGRGLDETGYLTREQADALIAAGLRSERERLAREEAARKEAEREAREAEARRERERRPGTKFRDCPECPELVVVPSGSFMMGSPASEAGRDDDEGPVRRVTIAAPFAVGAREVTRGEFARFVSATGRSMGGSCWTREDGEWENRSGRHWRSPGFRQGDDHPVVCVDWDDARAYVSWLSRETGQGYRLLSESEWEYVARSGTSTRYWWGDGIGRNRANCVRCGSRWDRTAPVGSFSANGFGLHDVHGNVWEWVEDCWNGSYAGAPRDGSAWESGDCSARVLRGGSWVNGPGLLRSAIRGRDGTDDRGSYFGFRVARTLAR